MRPELLALTLDDLAALSNRGIVKRAEKELEKFTFEWAEAEDGTITLRWSDEVECILPPDKALTEAHCTCAAVGLCRHLVRTVLAYQQMAAAAVTETQMAPVEPWDPGQISDEALAIHFRPAALTSLRKQFETGHVVELIRSRKPTAHFHTLSITVRFLAPHDIRYTHCDCDEAAPCKHVPLALWAFRLLAADQTSGIVTTRQITWAVPEELLDNLECTLLDLLEVGLAGASQSLIDRLRRLEGNCRAEGLVWPAEIVAELGQECERYASHDARFSATRVAQLIGELHLRSLAIRRNTEAAPQLFIRGTAQDQETKVGTARLVGLGCGVEMGRAGIRLSAYLQDTDSGIVVAVQREFANPETEAPVPFSQLARRAVVKGISLAGLGSQQLLIKGGKRLATHQFIPGRAGAAVNPQAYQWETLRSPALSEDFAEIRARLRAQPPLCLRPRRIVENFYICPVAGVEAVRFATAQQEIQAIVKDKAGEQALLHHPYTTPGRPGVEKLLAWLAQRPESLCFVAARVRLGGGPGGLLLEPVSLIFQNGPTRTMLQPWIDGDPEGQPQLPPTPGSHLLTATDPVIDYPAQIMAALGELFLNGLQRADQFTFHLWEEAQQHGAALGFVRYLDPVERLLVLLRQKSSHLDWDWRPAAAAALELALLTRLAQEELPGD